MFINWSIKAEFKKLFNVTNFRPYIVNNINKYEFDYIYKLIKNSNDIKIPKEIVYKINDNKINIMLYAHRQNNTYLIDENIVYHIRPIVFKQNNVFKYIHYALQNSHKYSKNINKQDIILVSTIKNKNVMNSYLNFINNSYNENDINLKNKIKITLNIKVEFYHSVKPSAKVENKRDISNIAQVLIDYNHETDINQYRRNEKISDEIIQYLKFVAEHNNNTIKFKSLFNDYDYRALLSNSIIFSDIELFHFFLQNYYMCDLMYKI